MDGLFQHDELYFWPVEGQFDVQAVGQKVESLGFTFRDPANETMYVVCPDEECRQTFSQNRRNFPKSGYPLMLLIQVQPERIYLNQFAGPEFYAYTREFVDWLQNSYRLRVTGEFDSDLTALLTTSTASSDES